MSYPLREPPEIIRFVEQSVVPVRRTLEKIGIPRATFCRCTIFTRPVGHKLWTTDIAKPDRVCNRIPDNFRQWRWMSPRCRRGN
jgi:putative transposase